MTIWSGFCFPESKMATKLKLDATLEKQFSAFYVFNDNLNFHFQFQFIVHWKFVLLTFHIDDAITWYIMTLHNST